MEHALNTPALRTSSPTLPRLSRRTGFWAVAFSFLAVTAFSTTPSALYGIYERQLDLSSLTITLVYAVYALGVVASLLFVGHLSDWYGRRAVLIPAVALAAAAALVFISWKSLPALIVARILTGIALGASAAAATAYITDLDSGPDGMPTRRAGIVATTANVGGLAVGPLVSGFLARYAPDGLTLPYLVALAALVIALLALAIAPEGHPPVRPRPRYRPQRLSAPENARGRFFAATAAVFVTFSAGGLLAGLSGTLLAGPLRHPSPALTGLAIFLTFGSGVVLQTTTTSWPIGRLVATGIGMITVGLGVLVASAWTAPPSLALFLTGGALVGGGIGGIFRGSLGVIIATSGPEDRAGALATFFMAGYVGVSLPVLGIGVALQYFSPRVTLLAFGLAVAAATLAAAPRLLREESAR
ncbi:MAG TPA: MFS transporter [Solirubrobacteraceae bacterium]|nr:MFS transporter [Solirubrobacteraceae bacterium]